MQREDPFVRFMREMEEKHYRLFPLSREDMERKRERYSNGLFGDALLVYTSNDHRCAEPSLGSYPSYHQPPLGNSSSLGSSIPASELGCAYPDRRPPDLSCAQGPWAQSLGCARLPPVVPSSPSNTISHDLPNPLNLQSQSLGISATYPAPFRSESSSLLPVARPLDNAHHPQPCPQILSVPTVPSNNPVSQEETPQIPPHHQSSSNSVSNVPGWTQPPSTHLVGDLTIGYSQYYPGDFAVPLDHPTGHPFATSNSSQSYHRLQGDSPSSSISLGPPRLQSPGPSTSHVPVASLASDSTPSTWVVRPLGLASPFDTPSPFDESPSGNDDEDPPPAALPPAAIPPQSPPSSHGNKSAKKNGDKKPPLACLFCRGRKIACGPPVPDGDGHTCNQCHRRALKCEYPAESRRGMRRKRSSSDLDGDNRDSKRSSSKSQRRR